MHLYPKNLNTLLFAPLIIGQVQEDVALVCVVCLKPLDMYQTYQQNQFLKNQIIVPL